MIWCHACQKETIESQFSKTCVKCGSWAIEDSSTSQTSPNQFRPFTVGETQQLQQIENQNEDSEDEQEEEFQIPFTLNIQTIVMESIDRPGQFTVVRVILRGSSAASETKNPISKQVIDQMQKVQHVSECTICQENGGEGLKLKCKHSFHRNCIQPWFEQSNTCPTCRTLAQ